MKLDNFDRYFLGFLFGLFLIGVESEIFKGWFPYFILIFCSIVFFIDMISKPK